MNHRDQSNAERISAKRKGRSGSYMEMIYIDSDGDARHTGVCTAMETDAVTWRAFNQLRHLSDPVDQAEFLCDYRDRKGDVVDTIAIHRKDFTRITGESVKSEAEYRCADAEYWREALSAHSRNG